MEPLDNDILGGEMVPVFYKGKPFDDCNPNSIEKIPFENLSSFAEMLNSSIEKEIDRALEQIADVEDATTDLRDRAINVLRKEFSGQPARVAQITDRLWVPDDRLRKFGRDPDASRSRVTPRFLIEEILFGANNSNTINTTQVDETLSAPFSELMRAYPDIALGLAKNIPGLSKAAPKGYMKHMRTSGHDVAAAMMKLVQTETGSPEMPVGGTLWDIASGPGNTTAEAAMQGLCPAVKDGAAVYMSDLNTAWTQYAAGMHQGFFIGSNEDAGTVQLPNKVDIVINAMGLQWFTEPEKTIQNIAQQLQPETGRVYVAGEVPLNAVANTVEGLVAGFHIFDEGGYKMPQLCRLFEQYGLNPLPIVTVKKLAMPEPDVDFIESLSPAEKKLAALSRAYAQHLMVCIGFTPNR